MNWILKREILLSEKLRAELLIWIFFYAIAVLFVIRLFLSDYIELFVSNTNLIFIFQGTLLIFIIREAILIKFINRRLELEKDIDHRLRYISNLVEVSYPTIVLIIIGFYFKSVVILFTPVVYFYFLIITLSTLSLEFKISLFAGITAAIGYLTIFFFYKNSLEGVIENNFLENELLHFGKAGILVLAGFVAGFVANQMKKRMVNVNNAMLERNKIINLFGQQISSSIVDELLKNDNEIATKEKYVCVMFLDIRDFTRFAEKKRSEEIINYQNKVFGFMIEIINKHHGIINQFLGDGYMATFGLPLSKGNDSQNAVSAALEIIDVLNEKNERGEFPETRIGIGLHSGLVVAGNVGTDERKQYSISGNTVIMASRIEQLNKKYQSQLLISRDVMDNVQLNHTKPTSLGNIQLKGREESIEIWQLK